MRWIGIKGIKDHGWYIDRAWHLGFPFLGKIIYVHMWRHDMESLAALPVCKIKRTSLRTFDGPFVVSLNTLTLFANGLINMT